MRCVGLCPESTRSFVVSMKSTSYMNAETTNDYLLLFRGSATYRDLSPTDLQNALGSANAWFDRLGNEGTLKAAQPLAPKGKIVSGRYGTFVSDGPFAESKEAVGGYFIVQAGSLEQAVEIAKGCPMLEYGAVVEVRPIAEKCPCAAEGDRHEENSAIVAVA